MAEIKITMRDGAVREFRRPEGEWRPDLSPNVYYVPGFVVVTTGWDCQTAIPSDLIVEVETRPEKW